ncbi:MAG: hypothetical protein N2V74_07675 [Candidatus Methanospirare jalkutatii]|nr:MAG: hypothetical protein N2V74_07675 [Candidatus Methanospirare jalkutatii]
MNKIWAVGIIAMLVAGGIGLAVAVGKQKADFGAIDLENATIHEIGGFVAVKPGNEVTIPDNATAVAVIYKINPNGTKEVTKIINGTDLKMKGYVGYMVREYANGTTIEKALTKEDLNELEECRHYCNMTDNIQSQQIKAYVWNICNMTVCCNITENDIQPQQIYHRACAWNYITGESRCIATGGHPLYGCGAKSCNGWTDVYTFWC